MWKAFYNKSYSLEPTDVPPYEELSRIQDTRGAEAPIFTVSPSSDISVTSPSDDRQTSKQSPALYQRRDWGAWRWPGVVVFGILVICLTAIALALILRGRGPCLPKPATSPTPQPSTRTPEGPPKIATFVMECAVATRSIFDLCWAGSDTIVFHEVSGKKLRAVSVDLDAGTCHQQILDAGYEVGRLSCTHDGHVFVIDRTNKNIRFYNVKEGILMDTWQPDEVPEPHSITSNEDYIVIGQRFNATVFMYSRQKVFLRSIDIASTTHNIDCLYLSDEDILYKVIWPLHRLWIHNITSNMTFIAGSRGKGQGQFDGTTGVSQVPGGALIVADHNNNRLSVWSARGRYLHPLRLVGSKAVQPAFPSVTSSSDGAEYLAFRSFQTVIEIFRLE